jgi:MFS family permease
MATSDKTLSRAINKGFYGWFALSGAAFSGLIAAGCFIYAYGVFLPIMAQEFGWSRAVVASGLSLGLLCFLLPSPLVGLSIAKFGPRIHLILGNVLLGLCLAGMSLVHEAWQVFVLYALAGLCGGFGGYVTTTTIANNWFIKKRPLAMGIIQACINLGGLIFLPITTVFVSAIGWRLSWVALGGINLVFAGIISGWVLTRNRPEDMGQVPDGIPQNQAAVVRTKGNSPKEVQEPQNWTTKQALRQRVAWFIAVFGLVGAFVWGTLVAHQVAYVMDMGFAAMVAAMTLSVFSAATVIGNLAFGVLALRFNMRYVVMVSFIILMIGIGGLLTGKNLPLIYFSAVFCGLSCGLIITALPTLIGAYFGRANFSQIFGAIFAVGSVFQAVAPTIAGAIYDNAHTYVPAFIILAVLSVIGIICAYLARPPKLARSGN